MLLEALWGLPGCMGVTEGSHRLPGARHCKSQLPGRAPNWTNHLGHSLARICDDVPQGLSPSLALPQ